MSMLVHHTGRKRQKPAGRFGYRRRPRALKALYLVALIALGLLAYSQLRPKAYFSGLENRLDHGKTCRGWNPDADPSLDPPRCLRAKQFRQLQAYVAAPAYKHDKEVLDGLARLEQCLRGETPCPERPLIVSNWWFMRQARLGGQAGEEVWMFEVVCFTYGAYADSEADVVEAEGFTIVADHRMARILQLSQALNESLHMFWMNENNAVECASNPRCIRAEDYRLAENPSLRHDLEGWRPEEFGRLPLWRLFTTTWWGSRPSNAHRPGMWPNRDWGITELPEGDEVWSFNPLGRRWQISPYPYPGHTFVPISMERQCQSTPQVAPQNRSDSVVVLGKQSSYFQSDYGELIHWGEVHDWLKARDVQFMCTANEDEYPLPHGLVNLGSLSKTAYVELLSNARALLGISYPPISPTPYLALCRGTPVVMPYLEPNPPQLKGWPMYDDFFYQHGPISALPEPYVYTYRIGDNRQLAKQLQKAISTPIKPYVPPNHGTADLIHHVRKMLYYNYEKEYNKIRAANGGLAPRVPSNMLEKCWEGRACEYGDYIDDYVGD